MESRIKLTGIIQAMKDLIKQLEESNDRKYSKGLEKDALGTSSPNQITELISSCLEQELGSKPVSLKFFAASAALVYGFTLEDGREVVLKVFPSDWDKSSLEYSRALQNKLSDTGYPITKPLSKVFTLSKSHATVDLFQEGPSEPDIVDRKYLQQLVKGLTELSSICQKFKQVKPRINVEQFGWTETERWGKQVRPEVNLDDNPEGAEWIEELGHKARLMNKSPSGRTVISHDDWLPHNVKLNPSSLSLEIVYDWDSLCRGLETVFVGKALTSASAEDIDFFISTYEKSSGYNFNEEELTTIAGTALWMRAFLARWEHSQSTKPTGYLRERLKNDSEAILRLPKSHLVQS